MLTLKRFSVFVVILFLLNLLLIIFFQSCRDKTKQEILNESIANGKQLASLHCQSCHQLPDPSLLNKKSWETGVLPHMGPLLGIYEFNYQRYPFIANDRNLSPGYYPAKPAMNNEEWQNILDYYIASSPDTLPAQQRKIPIAAGLPLFTAHVPAIRRANPAFSYVKIETLTSSPELIACDIFKQNLYRFDKNLKLVDSIFSSGAIVDMNFEQNKMLSCNIGTLNPTNNKYGESRYITINSKGKMKKDTKPLFDRLTRPVQITSCDLNKDGKTDYLVCEFGYLAGSLSWEENTGNNTFVYHVLRPLPGAVRAYIQDYNHDGLEDIWVLFAQGEEGIFLFTNKGNGQFDQKEVLRFPPSYGSSYFEMADFNKDGHRDIVYTCGDNGDYSNVLKPYHGVYIFINDGTNHFKQQYFYPVNGCYKAIARDFDNDGDLDIATIAFFADYARQPEEGFLYFENKGNFAFKPYTLPDTQKGRWITMDAGDLDGDGKIDLVLGNFSTGPTMMKSKVDWAKGPPFMVLKNTGKAL